ncbi:hypothetical protein DDR33_06695 [Pararcticibacter amylolyticus]|uniref:Uncharacterized protein n=1 Tax=Pararcticibacter amylolyticus TaxID=2173175 RepID=A0A2U2PJS1_9SPHI|nr:hypothetical protein DDR33_06695 [Pararcticibacter amylolyticus]
MLLKKINKLFISWKKSSKVFIFIKQELVIKVLTAHSRFFLSARCRLHERRHLMMPFNYQKLIFVIL